MDIARVGGYHWASIGAAVLSCVSLAMLFVTACLDPGIIPRKQEQPSGGRIRPQRKQDFIINGKVFSLKYCGMESN
jgi:hypothetical protein